MAEKHISFSKHRLPVEYSPYTPGKRAAIKLGTKSVTVSCKSACGRCSAIVRSTNRRCAKPACIDFRYCVMHLASLKHLAVVMSRHVPGTKGLYAVTGAIYKKKTDGTPKEDANVIVFRRGDHIDEYGGERMTKDELNARYEDREDRETAPYAMSRPDGAVLDAMCARTAIAYSNDSTPDVARLLSLSRDAFATAYNAGSNADNMKAKNGVFEASRDIHHGEELLWHYGADYWTSEGMRRSMTTGRK